MGDGSASNWKSRKHTSKRMAEQVGAIATTQARKAPVMQRFLQAFCFGNDGVNMGKRAYHKEFVRQRFWRSPGEVSQLIFIKALVLEDNALTWFRQAFGSCHVNFAS